MPFSSPLTWSILAVGALASAPLFVDGTKALNEPEPITMTATLLEYRSDGKIYQQHSITGYQHVVATWEARIERDGMVLCEGSSQGGTSSYERGGKAKGYTPDDWVNADCPDKLQRGDSLWARWEYRADGADLATERAVTVD